MRLIFYWRFTHFTLTQSFLFVLHNLQRPHLNNLFDGVLVLSLEISPLLCALNNRQGSHFPHLNLFRSFPMAPGSFAVGVTGRVLSSSSSDGSTSTTSSSSFDQTHLLKFSSSSMSTSSPSDACGSESSLLFPRSEKEKIKWSFPLKFCHRIWRSYLEGNELKTEIDLNVHKTGLCTGK